MHAKLTYYIKKKMVCLVRPIRKHKTFFTPYIANPFLKTSFRKTRLLIRFHSPKYMVEKFSNKSLLLLIRKVSLCVVLTGSINQFRHLIL